MKEEKFTCNQCSEEMDEYQFGHQLEETDHILKVCSNPKCPNFGLLQVPKEKMK